MPQHAAVIESASQAHREGLEMLRVDGGQGRLAALANVDPAIPVPALPGAQDQESPQQNPPSRPGGRQGQPPRRCQW